MPLAKKPRLTISCTLPSNCKMSFTCKHCTSKAFACSPAIGCTRSCLKCTPEEIGWFGLGLVFKKGEWYCGECVRISSSKYASTSNNKTIYEQWLPPCAVCAESTACWWWNDQSKSWAVRHKDTIDLSHVQLQPLPPPPVFHDPACLALTVNACTDNQPAPSRPPPGLRPSSHPSSESGSAAGIEEALSAARTERDQALADKEKVAAKLRNVIQQRDAGLQRENHLMDQKCKHESPRVYAWSHEGISGRLV